MSGWPTHLDFNSVTVGIKQLGVFLKLLPPEWDASPSRAPAVCHWNPFKHLQKIKRDHRVKQNFLSKEKRSQVCVTVRPKAFLMNKETRLKVVIAY